MSHARASHVRHSSHFEHVTVPPGTARRLTGRLVRVGVFVMLGLSAAVAAFSGERLWSAWREGRLPIWAPMLAPATFAAFVGVFLIDRWILVRRHGYPVPRAAFQVVTALIFATLLLPRQVGDGRGARGAAAPPAPEVAAMLLLGHADGYVRAAACDLAGTGPVSPRVAGRIWALAHHDADAMVRTRCTQALDRLHRADP